MMFEQSRRWNPFRTLDRENAKKFDVNSMEGKLIQKTYGKMDTFSRQNNPDIPIL